MIKVGLTGNIGSGKTTVAKIFETLGVPVFHADIEARKFLSEKEVLDALVNEFGIVFYQVIILIGESWQKLYLMIKLRWQL